MRAETRRHTDQVSRDDSQVTVKARTLLSAISARSARIPESSVAACCSSLKPCSVSPDAMCDRASRSDREAGAVRTARRPSPAASSGRPRARRAWTRRTRLRHSPSRSRTAAKRPSASTAAVSDFMANLKSSGKFKDVEIVVSRQALDKTPSLVTFEVTCKFEI